MSKKYKCGFICGFFDILHDGHIDIFKKAKELCDFLIVAVGTDEFMITRKHRKSILTYEQRKKIIESMKYVDLVVPQENLDKVAAFYQYHFDVMFSGMDHIDEPIYIQATNKLKTLGVDTIYFERTNDISSTKIREKVIKLNS